MRRLLVVVIALCLAGTAFAVENPSSNRWDNTIVKGLGDGAANPRTGGDTIEDATVIPSLPYSDAGATCGFTQNYIDCVSNSGAPDVVYAFTPTEGGAMNVSLCGSGYDTGLWVYAGGVGNTVGCNDDFCSLQSEIDGIAISAGVTYYIVISGYSTACGSYTLNVTPVQPCDVVCPAGSVPEGEPMCGDNYVDNYNGGCNSTGWTTIAGDANNTRDICGLSGCYLYNGSSYRDTDWYEALGTGGLMTFAVEAEFPLQILMSAGNPTCANVQWQVATAPQCVVATLSGNVAANVTTWLWVGPSVYAGVPCTAEYWVHATGVAGGVQPAMGACCVGDVCTVTTQAACTGTYMGDNTVCTPNPCVVPVEPTSWGTIKNLYK